MSEENPYGGTAEPPDQPPPGNYPAYPSGVYPAAAPKRDGWKIWVGIALAIPVLIAISVLAGLLGTVDDSGATSVVIVLAGLVGPVVLLFFGGTRKLGLGLLIGYAALFILAAGACIALLASYN